RGNAVALAEPVGSDLRVEAATYVVVDLETTGLRPGRSQICEIGAVRVRQLELEAEFQTLVDPGMPLGPGVASLTGLSDRRLRGAPRVDLAMRRFLAFAGDAVLVAHNARFDLAFLDRETERLTGSRIAAGPGRLRVPRPQRPGALRRPRPRPARPAPVVLPLGAAAAGRRGCARCVRADRVARARLRARGRAGGAAADPGAAPARERP